MGGGGGGGLELKGEMQLKSYLLDNPYRAPGQGVGEELATQGPSSVSCPVDSEGRGLPLVEHIFKSLTPPPPFDRNMYCEEWGWGGVCWCPAPQHCSIPTLRAGEIYICYAGSRLDTTSL